MQRDALIDLLLQEQGQKPKTKPRKSQGEDIIEFLGNAAPIVGSVAGGVLGTAAGPVVGTMGGAALGGGVGAGVDLATDFYLDSQRKRREEEEMEQDKEAMRSMAQKRALMGLVG